MKIFNVFLILSTLGLLSAQVSRNMISEQKVIREKMKNLQEKMTRLQNLLREQGREYAAMKLENAWKEAQEKAVLSTMEIIIQSLEKEHHGSALESEDLVIQNLEAVLNILLDRTQSLEEKERKEQELRELRYEMKDRILEEEKIQQDLQSIEEQQKQRVPQDIKDIKSKLENLIGKQQELENQLSTNEWNQHSQKLEALQEKLDQVLQKQKDLKEEAQRQASPEKTEALKNLLQQMEKQVQKQEELTQKSQLFNQLKNSLDRLQKLLTQQNKLNEEVQKSEVHQGNSEKKRKYSRMGTLSQ